MSNSGSRSLVPLLLLSGLGELSDSELVYMLSSGTTKGVLLYIFMVTAFGNGFDLLIDEVENHFGTQIEARVFDITGDVTEKYNWERWNDLKKRDPALAKILRRDCILKIPDDQRSCELCVHSFYDEIMCSFLCDKDNLIVDTYGVCRRED